MFRGCKILLAACRENFCSFLIQYYLILQEKVILRRLATNFPHFFFSDPQNLPRLRLSLYFFICLSPSTLSPRVGSGCDHARRSLQKTGRTNAEQSESCDVDGEKKEGEDDSKDKELITERGREKKWNTLGERWERENRRALRRREQKSDGNNPNICALGGKRRVCRVMIVHQVLISCSIDTSWDCVLNHHPFIWPSITRPSSRLSTCW